MTSIESLLHRRTDLSAFVVHFTRDYGGQTARSNLEAILKERSIEARNVFGMAEKLAAKHAEIAETQRVICFTETPLEHAWMMCDPIEGRQMSFNGYGLAFTRTFARRNQTNPVWYLDITPTGHDWLTNPVNRMVEAVAAVADADPWDGPDEAAKADILRLTPFIEQMGPIRNGRRKEFWWEREWRRVGDLTFRYNDIVVVFAPEEEHSDFEELLKRQQKETPPLVDARWGLERMIAALAGVDEPGPFPS
ncbi:abortive infection system antitoxin AbiGi family protein [Kitasatospora phosalacinea]|uniref:abortive infection system antitoxin AbiGi family protein n=1 Tax=Kitasatospora phosalacinea TaxID=2065 RepID=UPI0035D9B615